MRSWLGRRQPTTERDSKFVDWPLSVRGSSRTILEVDNVRSFDEFLERKFPESRRKAYYLMAIHDT